MAIDLTDDEVERLAELTELSEDERQAAMARLFNGGDIGVLRRKCYELLIAHWRDGAIPTNATFLFYELEQEGVVVKQRGVSPKTGERYRRTHWKSQTRRWTCARSTSSRGTG